LIGEIRALGCALCWAMSSTLTKSVAGKFEPMSLNLLRCLAASIVLWGIIPFTPGNQALSQAPWGASIYLLASAFIGISVGDTLYIIGLRHPFHPLREISKGKGKIWIILRGFWVQDFKISAATKKIGYRSQNSNSGLLNSLEK
jgi:hypothetical protein